MKIFNLIFAFIFLIFAALQYNDPDPYLWIPIYGAMVVVCTLAAFKIYNRWAIIILSAGYITFSFTYWNSVAEWLAQPHLSVLFDEGMKMQYLYVEEAREFLGLWICIAVLVIDYFFLRKKN
jgi:hypothetical protein